MKLATCHVILTISTRVISLDDVYFYFEIKEKYLIKYLQLQSEEDLYL